MRFCCTPISFDSQMISEAILSAFGDALKSERKELAEELQALLDQNLSEAEKELLLLQALERRLRIRVYRRVRRWVKTFVNNTFYKKYWFERISFAERSDGSPDMTLKMVATPPTDNNVFDDCYRWGGAVDALAA